MCGIIGGVASVQICDLLVDGLRKLEYRGYDSAGVALLGANKSFVVSKAKGKVSQLAKKAKKNVSLSLTGIAHTRWATHGKPNETNAHPHVVANRIAIVHNGIIENYQEIKKAILKKYPHTKFSSQTDTEVAAWHIYYKYIETKKSLLQAAQSAEKDFEGSYALAILDNQKPNQLVALRRGSPVVVGKGPQGIFVASDPIAIVDKVEQIAILAEGDTVVINEKKVSFFDKNKSKKTIDYQPVNHEYVATGKGTFRHYMEKEIHEQAEKVEKTLESYSNSKRVDFHDVGLEEKLSQVENINCAACGTSYNAASVARYWIEKLAGIPCQVEFASEYRYREVAINKNTLFLALSQSGETADTLAALHKASETKKYLTTLAICNSPQSSIVREAEYSLITSAGIEVSVASTKAFTTQLVVLFLLALKLANKKKLTKEKELLRLLKEAYKVPTLIEKIINRANEIEEFSTQLINKRYSMYIGRGTMFPLAQEGALKMKEISYIYSEAYPAGELKHGPLALIDEDTPVIVVSPPTNLLQKLQSNLEEIQTRGGIMMVFLDEKQQIKKRSFDKVVKMPHIDSVLAPLLYIVPLQLLAYQVAVHKGTDLDQPRNLAKSVTVE